MEPMDLFNNNVEKALKTYEEEYTSKSKAIPFHRTNDLLNIRKILKNKTLNQIPDKIEKIKSEIKKFKTGFWIFETGNSRLKRYLIQAINPFENCVNCESFKDIHQIYELMKDFKLQQQQDSKRLSQASIDTVEIQEIKIENQRLLQENESLRKQIKDMAKQYETSSLSSHSPSQYSGSFTSFFSKKTTKIPTNHSINADPTVLSQSVQTQPKRNSTIWPFTKG